MSIRNLVENKEKLDYQTLTSTLIEEFGISETINWNAVIPAEIQKNFFGGETLRLFEDHPNFSNQKDIRTLLVQRGQTSRILFIFAILKRDSFTKDKIQKITKKFVGGQLAERYVVWFFGTNERSIFKIVLSGKEGKKILLKSLTFEIEQPYYKTYDLILTEVYNKSQGQFIEPYERWNALWNAFDISVVNKRFYFEIKSAFDSLVQDPAFIGSIRIEESRKQFALRLIGRIIFIWFLKKKGLVAESAVSSKAVDQYENYYLEFLEKLFFDVLNTPFEKRRRLPDGIKDFPFLNGGLFESLDGDYGDYRGKVFIGNEWLISLFKNTLERYNFTVDENSSSSSEIAIDPEMLGRIFENLLAEQNPETKESARKLTGSFYTPREIVDYMVEQSLAEYLIHNLKAEISAISDAKHLYQSIEDFIHTEELPRSSSDDLQYLLPILLDKLNSIKILDPACGSGAFPIGMLQKIIALKQQLLNLTQRHHSSVYDIKLQTLLNSIYGCDIQPMAIELARLRCWLSLIIDEKLDKEKHNWGISSLPNLDFKFVCVNTLISLPTMTHDSFGTSSDDFERLIKLRTNFFTASSKDKVNIEKDFKELQVHIAEKHREWSSKNTEAVTMLVNWDPFSLEKVEWFDPFWMFGISSGFDITIGNPPYKVTTDAKLKRIYSESVFGRPNLYGFFIHRCLTDLLKPSGILAFINPKTILTDSYFSKLRSFVTKSASLLSILNFAERRNIFDSVLQACIINIFIKETNIPIIKTKTVESREQLFVDQFITPKVAQAIVSKPKPIIIISDNIEKYKRLERLFTYPSFGEKGVNFTTGKIQWDLYKNFLSASPQAGAIRLIWAENIQRYQFKEAKLRSDKIYLNFPEIINKIEPIAKCSIFVQRTTAVEQQYRIIANIIDPGLFGSQLLSENNTSYLENYPSSVSVEFILALLSSRLYDFIFRHINSNTHVSSGELNSLPFIIPDIKIQSIIRVLVKILIELNLEKTIKINSYFSNSILFEFFNSVLDGIIIELFFPEHMKEREIDLIEFASKDISELIETDIQPNSTSINNLYHYWNERDNPIRNRLMLFASRSSDLIKLIYEHKL